VEQLKPDSPEASTREAGVLRVLARRKVRVVAYTLRAAASLALMLLPGRLGRTRGIAGVVSAGIGAAYAPLQRFGSDGADQATVIAQASNAVARFGGDDVKQYALVFQAAQVTMSYGVAGWAKVLGEPWRDGTAVRDILRTKSYGHKGFWCFLRDHPLIAKALTWGVVVWEAIFPVVLFLPHLAAKGMAAIGLLFHVGNGPAMGLWRFIFAFASLHPALHRVIDRDVPISVVRRVTVLSGVMLAGAWVRSAIQGRRRARYVRRLYAELDQVATRRGAHIPVEISVGNDNAPVAILEGGLLAMSEQFHWVAAALASRGWTVLRTTRADYVSSSVRDAASASLDSKAEDLADVVAHVAARWPGRRICLVGHSLGGEIARRAGLQTDATDVVLLDPTHPNQFVDSQVQSGSRTRFTEQIKLFQLILNLGFGSFMTRPEAMASLPADVARDAMSKYSDAHLWNAGAREWKEVVDQFSSRQHVPASERPTLVISAGRTVEADAVLRKLHSELASDRHEVVDDVTHESLLSNQTHAQRCAEIVIDWMESRNGA